MNPSNVAFSRVQTGVFDPSVVGDKPKWYAHYLEPVVFRIWSSSKSILFAPFAKNDNNNDTNPSKLATDDSSSESDASTSSYSSLSDFVTEMVNSEIGTNTQGNILSLS